MFFFWFFSVEHFFLPQYESREQVGQTSVYSTEPVIRVGTDNTGQFLCTPVNTVGPSLTASLVVEIRGEVVFVVCAPRHFN